MISFRRITDTYKNRRIFRESESLSRGRMFRYILNLPFIISFLTVSVAQSYLWIWKGKYVNVINNRVFTIIITNEQTKIIDCR